MKALANPAILQMIVVTVLIGLLIVVCFVAVRAIRKSAVQETEASSGRTRADAPGFASAAFQGVIANLKESEKQLKSRLADEWNRFETLEVANVAVLENIPTGVFIFSPNLLVQQANAAGRSLLGYASPLNMHVKEVFRGLQTVELPSTNGALGGIGQAMRDVFAKGAEYRNVPATYARPGGETRQFRITLLPLYRAGQPVFAAMCLIYASDAPFTLSFPPAEADKTAPEPE